MLTTKLCIKATSFTSDAFSSTLLIMAAFLLFSFFVLASLSESQSALPPCAACALKFGLNPLPSPLLRSPPSLGLTYGPNPPPYKLFSIVTPSPATPNVPAYSPQAASAFPAPAPVAFAPARVAVAPSPFPFPTSPFLRSSLPYPAPPLPTYVPPVSATRAFVAPSFPAPVPSFTAPALRVPVGYPVMPLRPAAAFTARVIPRIAAAPAITSRFLSPVFSTIFIKNNKLCDLLRATAEKTPKYC